MVEIFIRACLGHLIGDYLLQSKYMALNKSNPGWRSILICSLHSLVYTIAVCVMIWTLNSIVWIIVFASHWMMDRWSIANLWLKLIKGRTFEKAYNSKDKYREFDIAFTSLVYTITDNTFHILVLWFMIKFLLGGSL